MLNTLNHIIEILAEAPTEFWLLTITILSLCVGSFLNVVIDDINGKIFSASSEYIKDVCMIYNDRKLLERLSRQAKVSTEMYSIRYFASKVEDVYRIAIKNYHRNLIPIFDKIKSMFGGKNK